jgi:hypothetical protein
MIPKEKIKELRKRMRDHQTVHGIALCVISAKELDDLLDTIENIQQINDRIDDPAHPRQDNQ